MPRQNPTVFIVDDDPRVLQSLTRLLKAANYEVGAFSTPLEFLGGVAPQCPGCAILDLRMPGMSGLELQETLACRGYELPIVFISGHGDVPASVKGMKAGAIDFLQKPFTADDLLTAVARALEKDAAARARRAEFAELCADFDALSPREREVASMVARGMLNKQIAAELGISEKTLVIHRARAMEKLGTDSVPDLVRLIDRLEALQK